MKCPTCLKETIVKETRAPERVRHSYIGNLSREWPDLVIRRRACAEHGTFITVELPLDDVRAIVGEPWKS